MTETYPGDSPRPPAVGAPSALPADTYSARDRLRHRCRHRPRQGDRRASSHGSAPTSSSASRKPEHLDAGRAAIEAIGAPVLAVECDIRDADSIAAAFDAAEDRFGLPRVLVNNAAANFPVPAEDMSPNAWRTVVDITLTGTFLCSREFAAPPPPRQTPGPSSTSARRTPGRVARGSPIRPRRRRGEEPGRDAGRRVGSVRHPGQRPRTGPLPACGHDRRHPVQPLAHP